MRINLPFASLTLCLLVIFVNILSTVASVDPSVVESKIKWLENRLMKHYWKRDQEYVFPILWEHKKGLFQSRVHFNILDKRNTDMTAFIRDDFFKIDDINMFVTSFVLYGLLEAK